MVVVIMERVLIAWKFMSAKQHLANVTCCHSIWHLKSLQHKPVELVSGFPLKMSAHASLWCQCLKVSILKVEFYIGSFNFTHTLYCMACLRVDQCCTRIYGVWLIYSCSLVWYALCNMHICLSALFLIYPWDG